MSKFTGNIIRLPAITPSQSSASGVFTLDDQFTAQATGTWPILRDQYFNYTTLLLTGAVQGTTGPNPVTQPYSFLSDASTNNFVVTPNGDVSARAFNPYLNSYSNTFNGSTDYLSVADNEAFNFGSGNFTIEMWTYLTGTSTAAAYRITGQCSSAVFDADLSFSILKEDTTDKYLAYVRSGSTNYDVRSSITAIRNSWVHIALVRSGGNLNLYINGQLDGQNTTLSTNTVNNSTKQLSIGRQGELTSGYFLGSIASYRIVKGTAVYTSNFTPPSSPLQNISGTSLLTCQSNRFIDNSTANSGSGFTITPNGTPSVSQNSPFVSYDTTNGSGYFDGTTDYLNTSSQSAFNVSNNAFTVEFWIYPTSLSVNQGFVSSTFSSNFHVAYLTSGSLLYFWIANSQINADVSSQLKVNQWNHIAVARGAANAVAGWVNGVRLLSGNLSGTGSAQPIYVGTSSHSLTETAFGYFSNLRMVNGTDVYGVSNTNITVPTAPLQAVTNTSLLTLQTRAPATNNGFVDSSPNNFVITRNGNTTQGTFTPFSPTGWSNYTAGSGSAASRIDVANTSGVFGSNVSYTIEAWVNVLTNTSGDNHNIVATGQNVYPNRWIFDFSVSGGTIGLRLITESNAVVFVGSTVSYTLGTWVHVAVVNNDTNNTCTFYINGNAAGTRAKVSLNAYSTLNLLCNSTSVTTALPLYVSNLRIVNGLAVYTGNFTPPTAPLEISQSAGTNISAVSASQTALLTFKSNRFVDNSSSAKTLTVNGTNQIQAFSPFAPASSYIPSLYGGSGYFDGTGSGTAADYLTIADSAALRLGSNNFTIQAWIYPTATPGASGATIIGKNSATYPGGYEFNLVLDNARTVSFNVYTSTLVSLQGTSVLPLNAWSYVVATRSGSNYALFVNGVREDLDGAGGTVQTTASSVYIGDYGGGGRLLTGYISGASIANGTVIYDPTQTTITVPTAPPTSVTGTSLLLNFTNGGIVDATGKNNLETVGTSSVQTSQAKWSPGSMYFNGSTDYLKQPSTVVFSGDFVIEGWVYFSSSATGFPSLLSGTTSGQLQLQFNSTGATYYVNFGGSTIINAQASGLSTDTWTHFAIVRSGTATNNISAYFGGTRRNQATSTATVTQALLIGVDGSIANPFKGYIDDFRITLGNTRGYTGTTITVPTGPFPIG